MMQERVGQVCRYRIFQLNFTVKHLFSYFFILPAFYERNKSILKACSIIALASESLVKGAFLQGWVELKVTCAVMGALFTITLKSK